MEKTVEQELLEKLENESKARETYQKELEAFKKAQAEDKAAQEIRFKKIEEEKALYEGEVKKMAQEKFNSELKVKFPDVRIELLHGTNEEKVKMAEVLQGDINEARKASKANLAMIMGKAPLDTPAFGGNKGTPEEEKAARAKKREQLALSGPKHESDLAAAMLNEKIGFGSKHSIYS